MPGLHLLFPFLTSWGALVSDPLNAADSFAVAGGS